jgi:hypothetical protein
MRALLVDDVELGDQPVDRRRDRRDIKGRMLERQRLKVNEFRRAEWCPSLLPSIRGAIHDRQPRGGLPGPGRPGAHRRPLQSFAVAPRDRRNSQADPMP